jgi:hypothetical protein
MERLMVLGGALGLPLMVCLIVDATILDGRGTAVEVVSVFGGSLGQAGGVLAILGLAIIGGAINFFFIRLVFKTQMRGLLKRGTPKEVVIQRINALPFSRGFKDELREAIERL